MGVFSSHLIWVTASIVGLTALLVAYRPAFEVLRFLSAAYLIYLGIRPLLSRGRGAASNDAAAQTVEGRAGRGRAGRGRAGRAYAEGVLSELSNPKTLIIFTTMIPPFLPARATPADVAIYG